MAADWFIVVEKLDRIIDQLDELARHIEHYYPRPQEEPSASTSSSDENSAEPTD